MLWFLTLFSTAFNYSLFPRALVVSINCPVRREGVSLGATQMFQQGRKERWSAWRHRKGLERWALWLRAPDKLIGSEVISTGTLPALSIDAIQGFLPKSWFQQPQQGTAVHHRRWVINWCDKSHGCPAVIGVAGGWKVENFWVLMKSNSGNPNAVWKPALWGMTLHFMLSGQKERPAGDVYSIKILCGEAGAPVFAGKIQQLPKCWLKEFSKKWAVAVWTDLELVLCLNSENPKVLKRDVENGSSLLDASFLILPSHEGTRQVSDAVAVMSSFHHHPEG